MTRFIFVLSVGALGFLVFRKFRLPMPALLGSMTAIAILAGTGHFPDVSTTGLSSASKIAIGIMMGRRLDRNAWRSLRQMVVPALLIAAWMIALSVLCGLLLARLSGIPLSTALIGSTVGGVNEMAIFALSRNYDAATVTIISVARLVIVLSLIPWLASHGAERLQKHAVVRENSLKLEKSELAPPLQMSKGEILLLIALSAAGGWLLETIGVPAGLMIGSLAAAGMTTTVTGKTYPFPRPVLFMAQIGLGIAIARQFGPQQIEYLTQPRFLASLAATQALSVAASLLLSYLVQRLTGWEPLTCLLSSSAGGLSQIVVVAEDMKADVLTIGVLHLARYLAIIFCMPILITLLLH